jgi:hypothetical protein
MSLKSDLAALRTRLEARRPPETIALMHRAVDELRASGIADRVLRPGQRAPGFALPNVGGALVTSAELLAGGPLVVTFYRGGW